MIKLFGMATRYLWIHDNNATEQLRIQQIFRRSGQIQNFIIQPKLSHVTLIIYPMNAIFCSRPNPFLALWAKIFILFSIRSVSIDSKMLPSWEIKRYSWRRISLFLNSPPEIFWNRCTWNFLVLWITGHFWPGLCQPQTGRSEGSTVSRVSEPEGPVLKEQKI